MGTEPENQKSKWPMRLAVISAVATVLAVVTPFMMPYFTKSTEEEIKDVLNDPSAKEQVKANAKELIDELGPPILLPPGKPGLDPPLGPPPFGK